MLIIYKQKVIMIKRMYFADFAVGAYTSGHAVVFRSHPVVVFNGNIRPNVERISFNATGFKANACVSFDGNKAPKHIGTESI